MRMMLVGAGAVGESILKVMQWRDQKGEWLKYVLVCDYDLKRAEEVVGMMKGDSRFEASKIDATNTEKMAELIRAVEVACTVWSGGKARDDIRGLPITIKL